MGEPSLRQGRDVSCLALTFFYDYLEQRGIPRRRLQEALPWSVDHLEHRTNWIDYPSFVLAERRMAELVPEPDLFLNIGRTFGLTEGFGFLRVLFRSVVSPHQVYAQLPRLVARFLFPFVHIRFVRRGPLNLTATYSFEPGFDPTDAFVGVVQGILTQIPAVLGLPPAQVEVSRESVRVVRFEVRLGREGETLLERARALPQRVVKTGRLLVANFADATTELEETNQLLLDKVAALERATVERDQRLKQVSLINALLHTASAEPDLMTLLDQIASTLSEAFGGAGTALLLPEGDPPRLVIAAARGMDLPAQQSLLSAVSEVAGAGRSAQVGGRRFGLWRLATHGEQVGVLALDFSPESAEVDEAALETISGEVAVILRNALALRTITELRDTLELRVQERTAELEEAHERLELTVAELKKSDRSRNDFFTNVSHELRTPLTLILASLDHLDGLLSESADGAEAITAARRNAQLLLRQINEILDFARLEADRMPLEPALLDLQALLADLLSTVQPLAARRKVTVHLEAQQDLTVLLDPRLGRRAFFNLVTNAIKYVNEGDTIYVRAQRTDVIRVEVADTGPGIPADQRDRIFERFQRGTRAIQRAIEGTGLGLPMVHEIITRHDGQVALEERDGYGAVFVVTLPLPQAASLRGQPAAAPDEERDAVAAWLENVTIADPRSGGPRHSGSAEARAHVLVAEDHPEMRAYLSRLLSPHHRLSWAEDGAEALSQARELMPDIVLADVMMPNLDGLETCRRLKADPGTAQIPVLLISARHGTDAALDAFAAGADDFIVKPFSPPELLARIDAQIRLRRMAAALSAAEKQTSLSVLSAGVAHEVLNPTNAVINAVPALRKSLARMPDGEGPQPRQNAEQLLDLVDRAGHRIRAIVQSLLSFSRGSAGNLSLRKASLRTTLEESLELVAPRLGPEVHIRRDYEWDGEVECSPELLRQVFANLLSNAADVTQGEVEVWVSRAGDDVEVHIADDGPGIPPAMRDRIFDAFFTTKPPGQGTGLGLALSREIASIHGGRLELASGRTRGAEFVVSLPLRTEAIAAEVRS